MTTLSSLRSGIKSIQRGEVTVPNSEYGATVTISSVNTAKTIVLLAGYYTQNSSSATPLSIYLSNSTTLTISVGTSGQGIKVARYEVVEFN